MRRSAARIFHMNTRKLASGIAGKSALNSSQFNPGIDPIFNHECTQMDTKIMTKHK